MVFIINIKVVSIAHCTSVKKLEGSRFNTTAAMDALSELLERKECKLEEIDIGFHFSAYRYKFYINVTSKV